MKSAGGRYTQTNLQGLWYTGNKEGELSKTDSGREQDDTRLVSSKEEGSSSPFGNKCAKIGNQLQIDQLEFVFRLGLGRLADLPHTSDRSSGLC
jgi:hypothetical protein